jgi:hypothetical protein
MGQQVRRRKQASIPFQINSMVSRPLARGMIYREIYLKLIGAPTLAGANNTQATTLIGDEWGVVKRIDLVANNTDVIRSFSGNQLWWINYFLYGVPAQVTPAVGDGATANVPFVSSLIIPCWMPRSLRPMDTALDARELSDLKIDITWGTFTDINASASAWTVEPYIEVHSLESFLASGPFSQWRVYAMEKEITATNAQFQVILPVGPMYRGFILNTTDAGKDVGTILNNFKVVSGTTVYANIPEALLHEIDPRRASIIRTWDDGGGVYDPMRRGSTYNSIAGWYFYDHVTDGYLTEAIDTIGFSEFQLELDVTVGAGTTKLFVLPLQIIPIRGR